MPGKLLCALLAGLVPAARLPAATSDAPPPLIDMRPLNSRVLPGPHPATRVETCLNGEWEFCPMFDDRTLTSDELMKLPAVPRNGWGTIRVPGKWKQVWGNEAADAYGYPRAWSKADRGWYRRAFTAPRLAAGQRLKLRFDGVLVYCEVLVNGRSVARHLGGVTPFEADITEAVKPGVLNALSVYVVNENAVYIQRPKSRYDYTARAPIYYSYSQGSAGIWRDVFLVVCPEVRIDNVAVRTSTRRKEIEEVAEVKNDSARDAAVAILSMIETLEGEPVRELGRTAATAKAGVLTRVTLKAAWPDARWWSPEDPHLYCVHTRLVAGTSAPSPVPADEHFQRFGFREFWIEGRDFFLNGRRLGLHGDWVGPYGAMKDAWLRPEYARALVRQLKGLNYCGTRLQTVGTVPAMLDACDELGMPIIATGISDSASFFDPAYADEALAHGKADMLDWLKRDRNHPSILLWSTENEDQPPIQRPEVVARYQEIDRVFLDNDPTRPFLHDGAAVSVARSDVDGWSPILCPHYASGRGQSFGERLDAFGEWSRHGGKPLVAGEEDVARSEEPGGYLRQMLGDRVFGELAERDALWGWYIKRLVGAWRSYGVSGIVTHGNHESIAFPPLISYGCPANATNLRRFGGRRVLEFQWDDLATPYAKPKYQLWAPLEFVNPWLASVPESMPTPLYAATREAFSPVLVTLARSLAHNYFTGETCAKDVYLVNEGPGPLDRCVLAWELRDARRGPADAPILSQTRDLTFAQGAIRKEAVEFQLPAAAGDLVLTVALRDSSGKRLAGDEMTLHLYARPKPPDAGPSRIVLYDPAGADSRTSKALHVLRAGYERIADIAKVETLGPADLLVIGAAAADRTVTDREALLKKHLAKGGRILVLEQPMAQRCARSFAEVKAPGHPAFRGVRSPYLSLWRTPSHNLATGALGVAEMARSTVLVDAGGAPVLVESRFGAGTLVMCELELCEGCLQGEPEAQIIAANLLGYLVGKPPSPEVRVRYLGDEEARTFLQEGMRVAGLRAWQADEELGPSDVVVVVGAGAMGPSEADAKGHVDRFVRAGGTVILLDPTPAVLAIMPEPVEVVKLPAAYLLKKKAMDGLIDGLGSLCTMRSEHAQHYFVADAIAGLNRGFRLPGGAWEAWYRVCDRATDEYKGLWRRSYYWESPADAVACFKHGRGRYVLAAMPIGAGSVTRDFLAALLANLNAPSTDTRCFAALDGLAGAPGAPKAGPRDWRGLVRVDLVPYCNRLFYDEVAGDGLGGWDDSGENDLRSLPTGDLMLCGIPFHVIDPRQDDPNEDIQNRIGHPIRSCIVLRGAARPAFPDRVAGIRIGQKLRKLHFLHTATWCGGEAGQPVARYVVHYADGTASELAVRRGVEIDDWTRVAQGNPRDALVAWRGSNRLHPQVGLYLTTWTNPHPEKEIATMDFVSAGAGVPILVAVTGQ